MPRPDDRPLVAYAIAFLAYVGLGFLAKPVFLNWIVGPLFLLVVLHVVPSGFARLRRRPGGSR